MHLDKRREEILKELKSLEGELSTNEQIVNDMQNRKSTLKNKINKLKNSLEHVKPPPSIHISDHALLRYMERHQNIDVEGVRQHIRELLAGSESVVSFKFLGFVVKGNTVITYVEPGT